MGVLEGGAGDFRLQSGKACFGYTMSRKGFYCCFEAFVWRFELYGESLWNVPDYFAYDLNWVFVARVRKGESNLLSNSEGLRSFEKHSASTYILDEPMEGRIPSGTLNSYETGFSGMLTSLFVLVELLVGICHRESLLK